MGKTSTAATKKKVTAGNGHNGSGASAVACKSVTAIGENQRQYLRLIATHRVVFGVGPAGTGKTYLAVATAARQLITGKIERIVLVRPAVEAGERLGFLPGDIAAKFDPFVRPLHDALHDIVNEKQLRAAYEAGQIEIAPLAFMRGRTLARSFIILDEAQNTTPEQMKMFLTRLGAGSQAVITGDLSQVDLPPHCVSGLQSALNILTGEDYCGIVRFTEEDAAARDEIVRQILLAYARNADCQRKCA